MFPIFRNRDSINDESANARQLLAAGHVKNPARPNSAPDRHQRRGFLHHFTNHSGIRTDLLLTQNLYRPLCILRGYERDKPSLIRNVKRIKTEHLARGINVLAKGNRLLLNRDFHPGGLGDFVERTCQSATSQITETVDFNSSLEQCQHRLVNWRGVAFDSAFKLQSFSHRRDRNAMPAQVADDDHSIAR